MTRASKLAKKSTLHCAELLKMPPDDKVLGKQFDRFVSDLARSLPALLAPLLGDERPQLTVASCAITSPSDLLDAVGSHGANSVLTIPGTPFLLLASIDAASALSLTDRFFGGSGEVPDPLPQELPMTCDMVVSQLDRTLCEALKSATCCEVDAQVAKRGDNLERLDPFSGQDKLFLARIKVAQDNFADWQILLAATQDMAMSLDGASSKKRSKASQRHNDPHGQPFSDLPLEIEAVIARLRLPLTRVSALRPGDTLPLALNREIPLTIADTAIAHGTIGTQDDRIAIQLTRLAS